MIAFRFSLVCSCLIITIVASSGWAQQEESGLPDTGLAHQNMVSDSIEAKQIELPRDTVQGQSQPGKDQQTNETKAPAGSQHQDSTVEAPHQKSIWKTIFNQYFIKDSSGITDDLLEPYEDVVVLEIGTNLYLKSNPAFTSNTVDVAGYVLGILIPLRLSYLSTYYHVRASFNRAVDADRRVVDYFTATNEVRIGKSFYLGKIPCQFLPVVGIGYNNGMTVTGMQGGNILWGATHYYFHLMAGICVRQLILVQDRLYSIGLNADYESAVIANEDTKQHVIISLFIGF